jgi:hypothetical protein
MRKTISKIRQHTNNLKTKGKGTPLEALASSILGRVQLAEDWLAYQEAQNRAISCPRKAK